MYRERPIVNSSGATRASYSETDGEETAHRKSVILTSGRSTCEGGTNEETAIVLQCLDVMLTKRRKLVTLQRAQGFLKRLSTLSLHLLPDSCVGILAANRALVHAFPKCDILLDNEMQGSGVYLPELDVQNTALWELHSLKEHFTIGDAFLDSELKTQIDAVLQNASEQTSLDFTSQHTQQET